MMRNLFFILLLAAPGCLPAQPANVAAMFSKHMAGAWVGTLTYTDYQDSTREVTMRVHNLISFSGNIATERFCYTEPGDIVEHCENNRDTVMLLPDGRFCYDGSDWKVAEQKQKGRSYRVVLERWGMDDEREAFIRKTITVTPTVLITKKEVQFKGRADFIIRNTYRYVRPVKEGEVPTW